MTKHIFIIYLFFINFSGCKWTI